MKRLRAPFWEEDLGEFMWQISGSSTAKNIFSSFDCYLITMKIREFEIMPVVTFSLKVNTVDFVIKLQKVTIFIINDTLGFPPLTRDSKKKLGC